MKRLATMLLVISASAGVANDEQYVHQLAQHGIEPNAESIGRYFESLHPHGDMRRRIEALILQLGADDFETREDATRQLLRSPNVSRSMLIDAMRSGDPEIRWRARSIIELAAQHHQDVFYAVMQVIASREIKGLVSAMLDAMPYFEKSHLRYATHSALATTAGKTDIPVLISALANASASVRVAAVLTLALVAEEDSFEQLKRLLVDKDEDVRLTAARVLGNIGERASLSALLGLLDSKDISVRAQSIAILRSLTGQKFSYLAYAADEKREAAVKSWQDWVTSEGKTAKLNFPLDQLREFVGRILVCNYSGNLVIEIDQEGNESWRKTGLDHPWGVQALPNGNRVVAACNGKYVVELDPSGKQVWRKDGLPGNPLSVQRLDNGNTLVSTGSAGKVMEIAPDGGIAWEVALGGFMADARRLPDGLTLIANYNTGEVVEVDRAGKIVWKIGGFKSTRGAQRLPNGNTLVTDNGNKRIVECDRSGNVVWKYEGLNTPYDSQRLPNGRTLIGDATGLRLVDKAGKTIWHRKLTSTGRIFGY